MDTAALARKHLDRQVAALRQPGLVPRPPRGWVRAIRDALGMTTTQLAERMDVSQPRVTDIEKREVQDALTLATLRKAAEALACTLVYALVPNQPLEDAVRARAEAIADARLARVEHTMRLEDQAVPAAYLAAERERLVAQILQEGPRGFWDPT